MRVYRTPTNPRRYNYAGVSEKTRRDLILAFKKYRRNELCSLNVDQPACYLGLTLFYGDSKTQFILIMSLAEPLSFLDLLLIRLFFSSICLKLFTLSSTLHSQRSLAAFLTWSWHYSKLLVLRLGALQLNIIQNPHHNNCSLRLFWLNFQPLVLEILIHACVVNT